MSVKECNRLNCEEDMCDNYSSLTQYLCDSCTEEMMENVNIVTEEDVEYFLDTPRRIRYFNKKDLFK